MPTKAELEADNKLLRESLAGLQASIESLGSIGVPKRVSVKDVHGFVHLIEPNRILQVVPGVSKAQAVVPNALPGAVIDSSIVLFNYQNDGRLGNVILPGKAEDVARLLGVEFTRVDLPAPTPRIVVSSAAEASAAIAAVTQAQNPGSVSVSP